MTLGSLTAVRGIARLMGHDTTIFNPQLSFAFIGNESLFGIPWLVIIAIAVVAISWFILRRTVLGVRIYAVGGNPDAAAIIEVNANPSIRLLEQSGRGDLILKIWHHTFSTMGLLIV